MGTKKTGTKVTYKRKKGKEWVSIGINPKGALRSVRKRQKALDEVMDGTTKKKNK